MYGTELIIMIVATLGLTLGTSGGAINVVGVTIFWRVILGIGIGGDYPNSSVLVSEFANVKWRGGMMAAMFSAQGLGAFSSAFASFLCVTGFRNSLQSDSCDVNCRLALDKSWRIVYGLGIIPAVIALYFRLRFPESIRWTLDVQRNGSRAAIDATEWTDGTRVEDAQTLLGNHLSFQGGYGAAPKPSFRDFRRYFGLWRNGKVLLGTAGSWFFLDIAFVLPCLKRLIMTVRDWSEYFSDLESSWV
jgi:PHS family inorganic phosphate transporter-like MFS transporter